jgi:hypothetical protein
MRKLILAAVLSLATLLVAFVPALAGSIGPTP